LWRKQQWKHLVFGLKTLGFMLKILDNMVTSVWIYDIENYCIYWANRAALVLWESDSLQELTSRDFKPDTSNAVQETLIDYQRLFEKGESISRFWRYSPKGILKEAYCQMSGYRLEDGRMALLSEALTADMVDRKQSTSSIVSLSTFSLDGVFISGNPPFLESVGSGLHQLKELFIESKDYELLMECISSNRYFEGDVQVKTKAGKNWYRLIASITKPDKTSQSLLLQQFDINERKLSELSLEKEVVTDPLTGLLNRRGLNQSLAEVINEKEKFVVFYIDLDGFKMINDSLGHAVGDRVLQGLATRLKGGAFKQGIACRFGGDEFIWVINEKYVQEHHDDLANRLINAMNEPYLDQQGHPMLVSASIGITHYPEDGEDFSKLILRADAAMYLAKKQGKRRWVNYIQGMENSLQRHSQLAQHLFQALSRKELLLYYQPIFNVAKNELHSFEALLRWNSPVMGWVPAEETIRVAEQVGIIVEIEKWVIETATRDLVKLRKAFNQRLSMAVNVSSKHFTDPKLGAFIISVLQKHKLRADSLTVELTESTLLSDVDRQDNSAARITSTGVSLSIDDFGTGYSSLAYLHKIPASVVKIDRSFTQRLEEDETMISSIHHLIKSLNFETLVEGVETEQQSIILREMGIHLQQGYGLGMPEPIEFHLAEAQSDL